MSQPVIQRSQSLLGVEFLWFKQLFHKFFIEHGCDDVIHNCKDREPRLFASQTQHLANSFHSWTLTAVRAHRTLTCENQVHSHKRKSKEDHFIILTFFSMPYQSQQAACSCWLSPEVELCLSCRQQTLFSNGNNTGLVALFLQQWLAPFPFKIILFTGYSGMYYL